MTDITDHFAKSRSDLKAEHDLMVQKIKEEVAASRRKALTKA